MKSYLPIVGCNNKNRKHKKKQTEGWREGKRQPAQSSHHKYGAQKQATINESSSSSPQATTCSPSCCCTPCSLSPLLIQPAQCKHLKYSNILANIAGHIVQFGLKVPTTSLVYNFTSKLNFVRVRCGHTRTHTHSLNQRTLCVLAPKLPLNKN